jgi:hypothetical protein
MRAYGNIVKQMELTLHEFEHGLYERAGLRKSCDRSLKDGWNELGDYQTSELGRGRPLSQTQ